MISLRLVLTMNLNTIESCLHRPFRGRTMFLHNVLNILHRHRPRRRGGIRGPIHRVATNWDVACTDRLHPTKEGGTSGTTNMPQLAENEATFSVHGIGDFLPAGNLRRCENTSNTWIPRSLSIHY